MDNTPDRIEEIAVEIGMMDELSRLRRAIGHLENIVNSYESSTEQEKVQDLQYLLTCVKHMDQSFLVPAVAAGYDYLVGNEGHVLALVSGDHLYVKTGMHMTMAGWQMVDHDTDPDTAESWLKNWKWIRGEFVPFTLVVVKYPDGRMHVDWPEPDKLIKGHTHLSHRYGQPQFWMLLETFLEVAPEWAKTELEQLEPEAKREYMERSAAWQAKSNPV